MCNHGVNHPKQGKWIRSRPWLACQTSPQVSFSIIGLHWATNTNTAKQEGEYTHHTYIIPVMKATKPQTQANPTWPWLICPLHVSIPNVCPLSKKNLARDTSPYLKLHSTALCKFLGGMYAVWSHRQAGVPLPPRWDKRDLKCRVSLSGLTRLER